MTSFVEQETMTHEEAKKFIENYLKASSGNSLLHIALRQMLHDWKKVYTTLEGLAAFNDKEANRALKDGHGYGAFDSPFTVETVRKLIQEL